MTTTTKGKYHMKTEYRPIGSEKAHHMAESYYSVWERLYRKERRAWKRKSANWAQASKQLVDHENNHSTQ